MLEQLPCIGLKKKCFDIFFKNDIFNEDSEILVSKIIQYIQSDNSDLIMQLSYLDNVLNVEIVKKKQTDKLIYLDKTNSIYKLIIFFDEDYNIIKYKKALRYVFYEIYILFNINNYIHNGWILNVDILKELNENNNLYSVILSDMYNLLNCQFSYIKENLILIPQIIIYQDLSEVYGYQKYNVVYNACINFLVHGLSHIIQVYPNIDVAYNKEISILTKKKEINNIYLKYCNEFRDLVYNYLKLILIRFFQNLNNAIN